MAPTRGWAINCKPIRLGNLGQSEPYGRLSLQAKVLWPMLLVASDDHGRGFAEPNIIKWRVCANVDELTLERIPRVVQELFEQDLITIYTDDDNSTLYQVKGWREGHYRKITRPSKLSPPPGWQEPRQRCSVVEWHKKRRQVMKRDGYICQYCGAKAKHVDHVIPFSRGGSDELDNLVAACAHCNFHKSAQTPEEAGMTFITRAGDNAKMAQDSHQGS